jgi:cobalt/nickel transport system ATP-binding protein
VRDVTFAVAPGERVALLGANGTGKSTLLHLVNGLFFASGGRVSALGQELSEAAVDHPPFGPAFRREMGFLFQNSDAQLFCATVEEELAFAPLQSGLARDDIERRVKETLDLLDIAHLRDREPQRLSAGEKKAVALASLLVIGPRILLLDEPTAGLDPRSQSMLVDILEQLHSSGVTLLTATHDLVLCEHVADRAVVLGEDHRVAADRPVEQVLGDLPLLQSVNLVHVHVHLHGSVRHRHAHVHLTPHDHPHKP